MCSKHRRCIVFADFCTVPSLLIRVVNKPVSQSSVERYFELNDLYKSTQLNDLTDQLISN